MPLFSVVRPDESRLVAGLMSGTSADGVDAVVARIFGQRETLRVKLLSAEYLPYDAALREALLRNAEASTSTVREITLLDALLARRFADAVHSACAAAEVELSDLDLIGSHGHTLHHLPDANAFAGQWVASTLQVGNPSIVTALTGVPTVGDFRAADVALGGQGAPLVPYVDWALFRHETSTRILLNLGGIANLTVLPAGGDLDQVQAFDTGPANMVIDALARRLLGKSCDFDGEAAATGSIDDELLAHLLSEPYFHRPAPKSTGREIFGADYVESLVATGLPATDLIATATMLTVRTVAEAVQRAGGHEENGVVIASGGGVHNSTLMAWLADAVLPARLSRSDHFGVDPDAKEALCFAVLAHEFVGGSKTGLPSVTGASRPARLGVIALP